MLKLSINKALLLRLFYTNPDQQFYIQEIGRILGKRPGVFQRTLYDMEREGILLSEYQANARYFRANKEYPLFDEYKSIVFKTIGVVGSIKEILEKAGRVDLAFLYGSFARNKENFLSDIDLVIVGAPDEGLLIRDFGKLEEYLKREINYKLYTPRSFYENARRKDPFLMGILGDRVIMLIGGEDGLRKVAEGSSYKKTKPGFRTNKKSIKKS